MTLKNTSHKGYVGMLGAGKFGTAIANIIALNSDVLMYVHCDNIMSTMQTSRISSEQALQPNIFLTTSLEELALKCDIIFIIVPSCFFLKSLLEIKPFIKEKHVIIHGTKGLHISRCSAEKKHLECQQEEGRLQNLDMHGSARHIRNVDPQFTSANDASSTEVTPQCTVEVGFCNGIEVFTMSELIHCHTVSTHIGCISGPNLAGEIAKGMYAATVRASKKHEVLAIGKKLLQSQNFSIYTSDDILGVELCGVFKNVIAIAVGYITGLGYGENMKALIISNGIAELATLGTKMGASEKTFYGLAGVGDTIATSMSPQSRNHILGYQIAKGTSAKELLQCTNTTFEGAATVQIVKKLADSYNLDLAIVNTVYDIIHDKVCTTEALDRLIKKDN